VNKLHHLLTTCTLKEGSHEIERWLDQSRGER
jgi:hypothetical protein